MTSRTLDDAESHIHNRPDEYAEGEEGGAKDGDMKAPPDIVRSAPADSAVLCKSGVSHLGAETTPAPRPSRFRPLT